MIRSLPIAVVVVLAALAAGCGTDESGSTGSGGEQADVVPKGPAKGLFTFSQWPV